MRRNTTINTFSRQIVRIAKPCASKSHQVLYSDHWVTSYCLDRRPCPSKVATAQLRIREQGKPLMLERSNDRKSPFLFVGILREIFAVRDLIFRARRVHNNPSLGATSSILGIKYWRLGKLSLPVAVARVYSEKSLILILRIYGLRDPACYI